MGMTLATPGSGIKGWMLVVLLGDADVAFAKQGAVSYYDEPFPSPGSWGWSLERGFHRLPPSLFVRYYFNRDNRDIGYYIYLLGNATFLEKPREWYELPELKPIS